MSHPKKIALGMSGGVDSSLCAHLLVEQGYEVTGIYLECWRAPGCRTESDRKDALKVALDLNIPFKVLDFKQAYKDSVVEYFFREYEAGRTPNPDILCNSEIKFGLFFDWAIEAGFDAIATGHYAKVEKNTSLQVQEVHLKIPKDSRKDQTYFLHQMTQKHLSHTLFPLADLTKQQVRELATQKNIHVSQKKDSVGICFIGDINVHEFLKERLGENPGDVVLKDGSLIGKHTGLWFYTIGQRSGFTVNQTRLVQTEHGLVTKHTIPPFYVIAKDPEKNQLVVGFGADTQATDFTIEDPHWISTALAPKMHTSNLSVRIRHTGALLECTYDPTKQLVMLAEPTQGIAAGQFAVFYTSDTCLGGGVIGDVRY